MEYGKKIYCQGVTKSDKFGGFVFGVCNNEINRKIILLGEDYKKMGVPFHPARIWLKKQE